MKKLLVEDCGSFVGVYNDETNELKRTEYICYCDFRMVEAGVEINGVVNEQRSYVMIPSEECIFLVTKENHPEMYEHLDKEYTRRLQAKEENSNCSCNIPLC